MNKYLELKIKEIYKRVYKQVYTSETLLYLERKDMTPDLLANIISESKQYDEFCKKYAEELTKASVYNTRGKWRTFYEVAKKRHLIGINVTYTEYETKVFRRVMNENFKMIKSIPQRILNVYKQKAFTLLQQEILEGSKSRGAFMSLLKEKGVKNARMIARTETAKLQTIVLEERATNLGSRAYFWISSNDGRTRESHKEMNKVIVLWTDSYDAKPFLDNMHGDAGEFPNCRCTAEPIFTKEDIPSGYSKFYNSETHEIEKLPRLRIVEKVT